MRNRRLKPTVCTVVITALLMTFAAPGFAMDTTVIRSILIPGSGQAHQGRYSKAAIFAGLAVVSAAGLFASQVHYNRAVENFNDQKRTYDDYQRLLDDGNVFSKSEIDATYAAMEAAHDDADSRATWRNVFLGALITTYALNIVDVLISEPETGEMEPSPAFSLQVRDGDVMVVKSFSF